MRSWTLSSTRVTCPAVLARRVPTAEEVYRTCVEALLMDEDEQCGRPVQNNTFTETLVFHQTLSIPKASYSGWYPSGTPQGRARKIHIFPQGCTNENELQLSPFHTSRVLKNCIITLPKSECGILNSGMKINIK